MKCPECGNEDAQQLLVTILCSNTKCNNYNIEHEIEVLKAKIEENDEKISSLEKEMTSKLKEIKDILDKKQKPSSSELQMELAIARIQDSNKEQNMSRAQMELEKIRHVSVMDTKTFKITRKLAEESLNKVKTEDPLDAAMKEYLQRIKTSNRYD